jgi:hypothetical protein
MQIMKSNGVSWLEESNEDSIYTRLSKQGIQYVICTDIAKKVA